jgi:hypothetical protein
MFKKRVFFLDTPLILYIHLQPFADFNRNNEKNKYELTSLQGFNRQH